MIKLLLHLEGLTVFLLASYGYYIAGLDWILFLALFLTPDLAILGYLKDKRVGAFCYNMMHNYFLAGLFIFGGFIGEEQLLLAIGLILAAHIGIDRFLGYGLKYPTSFKETHLQKL